MSLTHRCACVLLNASTAPWWLAMIVLPHHRLTALALLLPGMAGPAGLTGFLAQRGLRPRTEAFGRTTAIIGNGERDRTATQQ